MEDLIRSLGELGLVETEARAYLALATRGPLSGYQVAKEFGLSRGNVYAVLKRLVEKGAARQTADERYVAVALASFLDGRLATVDRSARLLQEKLPHLNPEPVDVIA